MPRKFQECLEDADLTTPQGIKAAIEAGNALRDAMNSQLDPALLRMSAVQEQRKRFENYKKKLSRNVSWQLNNLFIYYGNHKGESERTSDGLVLPQHTAVYKELSVYTELMHWLKVSVYCIFYLCIVFCHF